MDTIALASALAHARTFAARLGATDQIDEDSHFTAADLHAIIEAAEPHADLEPAGSMTVDDLGNMA